MLPEFIQRLEARLQESLPGLESQLKMTSMNRGQEWQIREDHRKSGVLALFYPHDGRTQIVFMQRTQDGKVHGGQISFPGGKMEPEDADASATALREAEEELAIPAQEVQVLGQLTELYIPPSNFMVYPTVGYLPYRPTFVPSPDEVARVIEIGLAELLDPRNLQTLYHLVGPQRKIKAPAFQVRGNVIWGATAMMLSELLDIIRD
ncbi:MAG: CoA pyrophosphatase [Bacteroidota bacterium]